MRAGPTEGQLVRALGIFGLVPSLKFRSFAVNNDYKPCQSSKWNRTRLFCER